jgi:hypothetical protein
VTDGCVVCAIVFGGGEWSGDDLLRLPHGWCIGGGGEKNNQQMIFKSVVYGASTGCRCGLDAVKVWI